MNNRSKISVWVISLLLILSFSANCLAASIQAKILQIKMNRIYFNAGEEDNILANCAYSICLNNDTLFGGLIEASYSGVSYSYPDSNISNLLLKDSCYAKIQPADVDSLSPINIGILRSIPYGDPSNFPGIMSAVSNSDISNFGSTRYGNNLHTYLYDSKIEMQIDFESGILDAYISISGESIRKRKFSMINSPAPFFAALIPDISKQINIKGLMTTSMYYRFNEERISALFGGDDASPLFCLFPRIDTCMRMFEFNPEKGRSLLGYFDKKPKKLVIGYQNESLAKPAQYFADILSRDKIKVKLTDRFAEADVYLSYVPFQTKKPDTSFYSLMNILKLDSSENNSIESALAEIELHLARQNRTSDLNSRIYYLNLAQRIMMEDICVFPLFRPTLFFVAGENLKGYSFDIDGLLQVENLRKIVRPKISPDGIQ